MTVRRSLPTLLLVVLTIASRTAAAPAAAQRPVLDVTEEMDFDRPEAWALKTFASLSAFHSLLPPDPTAGRLELGLEVLSVPHFDSEQRTVGFNGLKEEDLNRAPAWVRLRGRITLGAGLGLEAGVVPPVEIDGVEATLVSLALDGPLLERERWRLGWRIYGQTGSVAGDFTCGAEESRFEPGSPRNPFGCEGVSDDEVELDHYGGELLLTRRFSSGAALLAGIAAQHNDLRFQVDAPTFGFRDRTNLLTDGSTVSFSLGGSWQLGARTRLGVDAHYAPLDVQRPGEAIGSDDLIHLRLLLAYRWR